jgi:hypothetical protein
MPKRGHRKPRPQPDPDPESISSHSLAFFEWMRIRGYSETTIASRQVYLGYFLA